MALWLHVLNTTAIMAVLLAGQQLLLFECGLLFLGGAGFYALGGYFAAAFGKALGLHWVLSVALTTGSVGLIAGIVGYPLLRSLRSDYFALATLGFSMIVLVGLRTAAPGGSAGFAGIPRLTLPSVSYMGNVVFQAVVHLSIMLSGFAFVWRLRRSRFGTLISAARQDENALTTLGFRPVWIRTQTFALAGAFAGLAGAMTAHYIGAVDPRMSSIQQTVLILSATILSGSRTVWGTLIGAFFLVALPELLQQLIVGRWIASWQMFTVIQLIYGILITVVAFTIFPRSRSLLRSNLDGA